MACECDEPREATDPRRAATCRKCGRPISGDWVLDDQTVSEFMERFYDTFPGRVIPRHARELRAAVETRERAGRRTFGFRYLTRDNVADGREEVADAVLYGLCALLQERRNGTDTQDDIALEIAQKASEMWQLYGKLRARERGAA